MKEKLAVVIVLACAVSAPAVSISTVPIGNPGNLADTRYIDSAHPNGAGAVAYAFNIGKTEITNAQYVPFLNAVAGADPYGLYRNLMSSSSLGGIVRSGVSGSFSYAVKAPALSGTYTYDDKPVVYVSSGDAMRFANWLHNGQPTGAEDVSTTEDGAYTLNGTTSDAALMAVGRNPSARWWLPSGNEWYKAAYYNPDVGTYNDYPTKTSSVPDNNQPPADTGNSANFKASTYTTGSSSFPLTNAGAYTLSSGPFGTFDQGGSVFEWNDSVLTSSIGTGRERRGGSWLVGSNTLWAAYWVGDFPTSESDNIGFRVASVPEPSTIVTLTVTSTFLSLRRRKSVRR